MQKFEKLLINIFRLCLKYNKTTFSIFIIILGLFISQIPKLKFDLEVNNLIGQKSSHAKNLELIKEKFKEGDKLFAFLIPNDNKSFSAADKKKIYDITRELKRKWYNDIESMMGTIDLRYPQFKDDKLLYPSVTLMDSDAKESHPFYKGIFTDFNEKDYLVQINFESHLSNKLPKKYIQMVEAIILDFELLITKNNIPATLKLSGTSMFKFYMFKGTQFNSLLNLLSLFSIILFFKLFYRSWSSGLILCMTFIGSFIVVLGVMTILDYRMEFFTSSVFIIIMLSSLEDYLFICQKQQESTQDLQSILEGKITPSFFTSLTTIIGFMSLYLSDVFVIQKFGLLTSLGAISEWLMTFFFLPAFLKIINKKTLVPLAQDIKSKFMIKIRLFKIPRVLSYCLLLSFLFLPLTLGSIPIDDSLVKIFPPDHQINDVQSYILKTRGWQGFSNIIFNNDKGLTKEQRQEITSKLNQLTGISKVESLDEIIDYAKSKTPEDIAFLVEIDIKRSSFSKRYLHDDGTQRLIIYFKDIDYHSLKRTMNAIKTICVDRCQLVGDFDTYIHFIDEVPITLIKSFSTSMIIVALVLFLIALFKKQKSIFAIILASLWGPTIVLCLFYLTGASFNLVTCTFATILVGLTGDNAIQFMFKETDENLIQSIENKTSSAFKNMLYMSLISILTYFSYFEPPRSLGLFLILGFVASYIGDVYILKSLLSRDSKKQTT